MTVISPHASISATIKDRGVIRGIVTAGDFAVLEPPHYEGEYTVTPTTETQTLPVQGLAMSTNLTVNPIPSEYQLVVWGDDTGYGGVVKPLVDEAVVGEDRIGPSLTVTKGLLDLLANKMATKLGMSIPMTISEMTAAVDSI